MIRLAVEQELHIPVGETDVEVRHVAVCADESMIAGAAFHHVFVWRRGGELLRIIRPYLPPEGLGSPLRAVEFSPDGRSLVCTRPRVSGSRLIDIAGRAADTVFDEGRDRHGAWKIDRVTFDRSGALVADVSGDGCVRLYAADSGQLVRSWYAGGETTGLTAPLHVVFGDGSVLVTGGSEQVIRVWEADGGELLAVLKTGTKTRTKSLAVSADGSLLLVCVSNPYHIQLWDMRSFQLLRRWRIRGPVEPSRVAWGPGNSSFACVGYPGLCALIETSEGEILSYRSGERDERNCRAVAWRGDTIAIGTRGGVLLARPPVHHL